MLALRVGAEGTGPGLAEVAQRWHRGGTEGARSPQPVSHPDPGDFGNASSPARSSCGALPGTGSHEPSISRQEMII